MLVLRRYAASNRHDRTWTYFVERVDQPVYNVMVHRVWHQAVEPVLERLEPVLEPLLDRWHHRTCHDDCGIWTDMKTGEEKPGCARLGLSGEIDCTCFDLGKKNATTIDRMDLNEHTWEMLKADD